MSNTSNTTLCCRVVGWCRGGSGFSNSRHINFGRGDPIFISSYPGAGYARYSVWNRPSGAGYSRYSHSSRCSGLLSGARSSERPLRPKNAATTIALHS
jgi:hypothetical protein